MDTFNVELALVIRADTEDDANDLAEAAVVAARPMTNPHASVVQASVEVVIPKRRRVAA